MYNKEKDKKKRKKINDRKNIMNIIINNSRGIFL